MYEQISSADLCLWPLQRHRSRSMGNAPWNTWVLCESYLWHWDHVCLQVSAHPPSMQDSRSAYIRTLCLSSNFAFSPLLQLFHFMLKSQQNQSGAQNRAWTPWHKPPILPKLPDAPGLSLQLRGVCGPAISNEASFACWLFHPDPRRGRQPDPKLLDCPQTVLHIPSPSGNGLCFSAVTMVLTPHLHNTFWNGLPRSGLH